MLVDFFYFVDSNESRDEHEKSAFWQVEIRDDLIDYAELKARIDEDFAFE